MMGLFDKAKGFFGGKNMATVEIPIIERQPAAQATFPVSDSVLKGRMIVTAKEPCTVLATKYEIYIRVVESGVDINHYVTAAADPAPNTTYDESCLKLPCDLVPGQSIEQNFLVCDVDLVKTLQGNGFPDPEQALRDPNVSLIVKCIADVKGSPFDPSAEVKVRMTSAQ